MGKKEILTQVVEACKILNPGKKFCFNIFYSSIPETEKPDQNSFNYFCSEKWSSEDLLSITDFFVNFTNNVCLHEDFQKNSDKFTFFAICSVKR